MKEFFKNKIVSILVIIATLILAGVAVFSALRLYQLNKSPVAPSVPESEPVANEVTQPDIAEESVLPPQDDQRELAFNLTGTTTPAPTTSPTPSPTLTPTPTQAIVAQATITPTSMVTPSLTPSPTPTTTPTLTPTLTPSPTLTPTPTQEVTPSLPEAGVSSITFYLSLIGILGLVSGGLIYYSNVK